jgi:hypothetical protein
MSKSRSLQYKKHILNGTMLCIDPSSGKTSAAGWAWFDKGVLIESGTVTVADIAAKEVRLRQILACLQTDFDPCDLLIIEHLDGFQVPLILKQACGVFMSALESKNYFSMNVQSWRAVAKRLGGWKKTNKKGVISGDPNGREGDDADSEYIGWAAIAFASGYNQKDSEDKREEILKEVRERMNDE